MDRLTEKIVCNLPDEVLEELGIADIPKEDYEIKGTNGELCRETCEKYECDSCPIKRAIEKLADYEDVEEQDLLLRLPCKVGDTVWYIDDDDDDYPLELLVTKIEVEENDYLRYHAREKDNCGKIGFIKDDIGKTVFLTKEEAEQVLKQMGEREDE